MTSAEPIFPIWVLLKLLTLPEAQAFIQSSDLSVEMHMRRQICPGESFNNRLKTQRGAEHMQLSKSCSLLEVFIKTLLL
jgi:hypothetical protein